MQQPCAARRQRAHTTGVPIVVRRIVCAAAIVAMTLAPRATQAATVSWNVDASGFWDVGSNWSSGMVPQPGDDVVIDRPAASVTVTFRSGTVAINSLSSTESFAITGGILDLAATSMLANLTMSAGQLIGSGNVTISGLFTWSGGQMGGSGATNANGGMTLNGSGVNLRTGRTLNNAGTATWSGIGAFSNDANTTFNNLSGATLAINTIADFFGGTLNNAGTITKTSGGGDGITRVSAAVNNSNAITVTSGALHLENGGTHGGSVAIAHGAIFEFGGGTHTLSAPASISGAGTMRFTAGTTNFNSGTYDVTGATECTSGTHTFLGAVAVSGIGALAINGGTLNFSSGELLTTPTYMQSAGTLTGTDTLTVPGLMTWTGGSLSGQGTLNANGGIMLTNTATISLRETRTLNNAGVATWSGAGNFSNETGAVFNNLDGAMFHIQTSGDFFNGTLNNAGTITKVTGGGDGITRVSAVVNNAGSLTVTSGILELENGGTHTGTFAVAAGTTLEFGGGTHTVNAGTTISGMGRMRFAAGTTNFNAGTYNITGGTECSAGTHTFLGASTITAMGMIEISGGTLALSSGEVIATSAYLQSFGTLAGNDTVTVSGMLMWMGGTMGGAGTTNANGGIELTNPVNVSLRGTRTLNNAGVATWTGASGFSNDASAVFNNLNTGTLAIQSSGDFFGGVLNNAGAVTKTSGGGDGTTRVSATVNNSGTIMVDSGTLDLENGGTHTGAFVIGDTAALEYAGGTHTLNTPASISGAGRMRFGAGTTNFNAGTYNVTGTTECAGGTHTFLGAVTVASLGTVDLGGGTLSLSSGEVIPVSTYQQSGGTLAGSDTVNVSGVLTWSGGTMTGQGTTNANGGLQLTHAFGAFLRETRTLNNAGAGTWSGAGSFTNDTGATFNNLPSGTLAVQTPGDFFNGNFNNAGTLIKTSGGGDGVTRVSGPFNNSGTVEVTSGILRFENSYAQSAGVTRLNGGLLEKSSAPALAINGGMLTGVGTVAANVRSAGTVAPGLSAGELIIGGDYEQTESGVLAVELGGLTPVTQFDRLTIAGDATLDGTVDVALIGGFVPSDGNSFRVLTSPSVSGDFIGVSGAAGFTHAVTSTFAELLFNSGPSGTATPTRTRTRTPTGTVGPTDTPTATAVATVTPTGTVASTSTPTPTRTHTSTITATPAGATPTPTPTGTVTPTQTGGFTVTRTVAPLPVAPVAAGEFGADDAIDLAAGNNVEPKIGLLRNSGQASFTAAADVALAGGVGGIADVVVGDMNNDGHLDAIAANPDGGLVGVALGNGQHDLAAPLVLDVDAAPRRLAVGAVIGGVNLDVVVATDDNLLVLEGRGDGTLEENGFITTSAKPADLIVADINGDGNGDVLAALPDRNLVALYAGNGTGGFASGPSVTGNAPRALALGRFTGRAQPDLVVANADSVAVYPPVPGGFAATPIVTAGVIASRLFATEVTGDQFLDLIAVDLTTGMARALPGDGTGRFTNAPNFAVDLGVPLGGATFADLNGDTTIDLAMTDPATQELFIALNSLPPPPCVGDCDNNRLVNINELITGVNIALDRAPVERCPSFDVNENLAVEVNELITGVNNGLRGCGFMP